MLDPLSDNQWTRRHADHLLSRAGFGGSPQAREELYQLGRNEGVAVAVDSFVEPTEDWSEFPFPDWVLNEQENLDKRRLVGILEFVGWYLEQMRFGGQLSAKLLKFFVDHFPVDFGTIQNNARLLYFFQYFDLLRRFSGGDVDGDGVRDNFQELVREVSWAPAMIRMLDLYRSDAREVNENFARELMELFTLGVDGGYTEQDVAAASAAFTGRKLWREWPYEAYQVERQQDDSEKSLLGATIVDGDDAIDVIFGTGKCAYHICWKLWRYFVAPEPDDTLLQELAVRFKDDYNYRLRPLLRDIFLSEEFFDPEATGRQIKDPVDYVLNASLSLETDVLPMATMSLTLGALGYQPMFPPTIAGWPEPIGDGNQWLSTGAMIGRLNLPGLWSHKNYRLLNERRLIRNFHEEDLQPDIDFDRVIPPQLRSRENFNLMITEVSQRLLPFHRFRGSQVRGLYEQFVEVEDRFGNLEAIKEMVRLVMALPEFQLH